jgi:hypothetical protein
MSIIGRHEGYPIYHGLPDDEALARRMKRDRVPATDTTRPILLAQRALAASPLSGDGREGIYWLLCVGVFSADGTLRNTYARQRSGKVCDFEPKGHRWAEQPKRDIVALRAEYDAARAEHGAAVSETVRLEKLIWVAKETQAATFKKMRECSDALAHQEQIEALIAGASPPGGSHGAL